uniref:uncharacterized protein LOC122605002 n=1 Tax=Erigeron canadensis TaxID=72917 RepID=UPI001CB8D260|nr:uncharacterized protein LOC122605002 [Erigeron canadensis]
MEEFDGGFMDGRHQAKTVKTRMEAALKRDVEKTHLQKILSATSNFSSENLIKDDGSGKLYKGQLLQNGKLMNIAVWRLDRKYGNTYIEFKAEISFLSSLQHKNISSIFEYYDGDNEKIIIYEGAFHGILYQHLHDPTLTWSRRLQICLGVARALNYIHYDVIHCDINSSKIFLDEDWEPRIFGFGLSTKYPQSWTHRLHFSCYFDSTSTITPKYDIYSYGVLLLEVLCGKKTSVKDNGDKEKLDEIIDPNLKRQMDTQSLTLFLNIAQNCLNQQLVERPTMDQIVKELEEVFELQLNHENLEILADAGDGVASNHLKMDLLEIPLSEIKLATNNFDEENVVGSGGYGIVYRAKLDVLDFQSLSSMEGRCKDELPRKRKTVAIKRMFSRSDEQGKEGFLTEIELLTRCNHPNIVSLLGFCREGHEMILVYEYAFKGSLSDYLESTSKQINFTWSQRIQICLDIAHGINYLHTNMEGKPRIIHRDIKSQNILLDENFKAKVADFGLSKFHPSNQQASTIYTRNIAGTEVYMDPEYLTTFKYKKESDVYSFGVVLFEILSGRLAYDSIYMMENNKGLAPIVRRRFNEGTLKELIDPQIIEEDDAQIFTLNRGPNQDSFDSFSIVAYQCLAETQAKRPTMEAVIKELKHALKLQGETMVLSRFRVSDIAFATENFAKKYCCGRDSNGLLYKAVLDHSDKKSLLAIEGENNGVPLKRCISVAIKRFFNREDGRGEQGFFEEVEMHISYRHPNIVPILGFCDEGDDKIIVYEHASNGSLDDYLRRTDNMSKHTWTQRLYKCLEIASGLRHLHYMMDRKKGTIDVDMRSANILLGKNWEAKIAYFGISKLLLSNQKGSTNISDNNVRTKVYHGPGELKNKSDIYSLGVILFEIFCGRLAYDPTYIVENKNGLAPIVCRCFSDGTIKQIMDPTLKEHYDEDILTSNRLPIQDSLDAFLSIAYQCLAEVPAQRPTIKIVIKRLEIALNIQENLVKSLKISLKAVESATENFCLKNCFGSGRYWMAYKGVVPCADACADASASASATASGSSNTDGIVAKRWDTKFSQAHHQFQTELNIIFKHKHENIIGLAGYCNEMDERIIVYENASNGSLDMHLDDASLTWIIRLKICIGVACGLNFLHEGAVMLKKVVHRNIQSHAILLHDDWKAKISNLELSSLDSLPQDMEHVSNNAYGANGYFDPDNKQGFLTGKSDVYSFGVVLFEILCGRLAWAEGCKDHPQSFSSLCKRQYLEGKVEEMVLDGIKEQIGPESLATFANIAYRCLHDKREERPTAGDVLVQLKKALEVQEDYEKWEAGLPKEYKEIIQMSEIPEVYSTTKGKDLYDILSKGILTHEGKVWFALGSNGIRNEMVSASQFSYENHGSLKWLSIPESRFSKIAEISDISNLKIKIKIRTRSLSVGVNYSVHLVLKFCGARKSPTKQMYVNLTYKMGNETLHAYFATWSEDGWMRIELYRFLNNKEDTDFEFLLESFSKCYCESDVIYVEGLECRANDNEKHDENNNLKEAQLVLAPTSNIDPIQRFVASIPFDICSTLTHTCLKLFNPSNKEKYYRVSAMDAIFDPSNVKLFNSKLETQYRFQKAIEILSTQVFRIKYIIQSNRLLPNTEYTCYLVFKLSENHCRLHCPVIVQDLRQPENTPTRILYFKTPHSWNLNDFTQCPEERDDGWMEVEVWKFKSKPHQADINSIYWDDINLKLKIYEGTMYGLIVWGLEFRPMEEYI